MKHYVILLFIIFFIPAISEASFELELISEEIQVVNVGEYADFEINLINTGTESDVFWLGYFFPYETFPEGWECEIWIGEESYVDSTTVELAPNEILEIIFRVYVESNGLGVVAFAVHPVAEPMEEDYVILTVATPDISIENDNFSQIPNQTIFYPNYPNPFNPTTTFHYKIEKAVLVSIKIYDITGKLMVNLIEKEHSPGIYNIQWDAGAMPSGLYFAILKAGSFSDIQKLTLLK